jgi:hypothetical protein
VNKRINPLSGKTLPFKNRLNRVYFLNLFFFKSFFSGFIDKPPDPRILVGVHQQGQILCSTNQRICLHFRSHLIIMQETRNLHQGELENIAVFSGFRDIQF